MVSLDLPRLEETYPTDLRLPMVSNPLTDSTISLHPLEETEINSITTTEITTEVITTIVAVTTEEVITTAAAEDTTEMAALIGISGT